MILLVGGENDGEENRINYTFALGVKLRAKMVHYTSGGNCGHAQLGNGDGAITLSCGVDCDGSGLAITLAKNDNSTLLAFDEIGISPAGGDDESARMSLEAGADDRSFRLDRTQLADCVPLAVDKKDAAAMRPGE